MRTFCEGLCAIKQNTQPLPGQIAMSATLASSAVKVGVLNSILAEKGIVCTGVKADKAQCLAMHVPVHELHQLLEDHAGTAPPRPKAKAKGTTNPAASIATASTTYPFGQPELEADKDSEQEQESDESLDSSSDSSSEQDKKVLEPDENSEQEKKPDETSDLGLNLSSEDFIELELDEAAEDSTTAKEQEGNNSDGEALPTRRRKRKMRALTTIPNFTPESEPEPN